MPELLHKLVDCHQDGLAERWASTLDVETQVRALPYAKPSSYHHAEPNPRSSNSHTAQLLLTSTLILVLRLCTSRNSANRRLLYTACLFREEQYERSGATQQMELTCAYVRWICGRAL